MRLLFPYFSLRLQWSVRALWWTIKSCYDRRFHQMFTSFFFCSSCMMSLRRWSAISSKNSLSFLKYCRTTLKLLSLPEIVNTNFVPNNAGVIFKWTCYEKTLGIATVFRFSPLITTSILDRPRDLSLIAFHENQLYLSCIGDIRLLWNTYSVENNLLYHRKN